MQKQLNLAKNKKAFTLFESLISLTILAIIISLVYKLSFHGSLKKSFEKLERIENSFTLKQYSDFYISNENIDILKDGTLKTISVKKVVYEDDEINIYKYEIPK